MSCHVVAWRTSKQLYPDDDIKLVHIERTSFSVKEHESLMGIKPQTTGWKSLEPSSPYLRMVWILDWKAQSLASLSDLQEGVWKLGLVGVDLLDDGVRECWPGVSLFCLFLERIDSHCVCFEENQFRFCFRLPCLEESLLSLAKLRLEEVWKSFTERTKCVDVWLKAQER